MVDILRNKTLKVLVFCKRVVIFLLEKLLRLGKKKIVLLVVRNEIMFEYAHLFYKQFRNDRRIDLWFCFAAPTEFFNLKKARKRIRVRQVPFYFSCKINWDLIIFPDHHEGFLESCPKVYIGHGLSSGKMVDGDNYAYGSRSRNDKGKVIYRKILRDSAYAAKEALKISPKYEPHVKIVGSLLLDKISAARVDRQKEFKKLNFDASKRTILIASSWGLRSLIQAQGVDVIKQLPFILKYYNVILSIHLNNFTGLYHNGTTEWKSYLKDVRGSNLHIVPPGENCYHLLPLVDILFMDMTSLGLYYTVFKRPIIYYQHPDERFAAGSLIAELKNLVSTVDDCKDLKSVIDRGFKDFDVKRLESFIQKVFSYRGRAWERYAEEIYDSLQIAKPGFSQG